MARITLYLPNAEPREFDIENYELKDGVLSFVYEDGDQMAKTTVSLTTTVPFMIREIV